MAADFTEKTLTSRIVYRGKLLTVKEDLVELPRRRDRDARVRSASGRAW